jgi:hypothetical protein
VAEKTSRVTARVSNVLTGSSVVEVMVRVCELEYGLRSASFYEATWPGSSQLLELDTRIRLQDSLGEGLCILIGIFDLCPPKIRPLKFKPLRVLPPRLYRPPLKLLYNTQCRNMRCMRFLYVTTRMQIFN